MSAPYRRTWEDVLITLFICGLGVAAFAFAPAGTLLVLYLTINRKGKL